MSDSVSSKDAGVRQSPRGRNAWTHTSHRALGSRRWIYALCAFQFDSGLSQKGLKELVLAEIPVVPPMFCASDEVL